MEVKMVRSQENKCLVTFKKNIDSNLTLFCFPYAGGSAAIFKSWIQYLPEKINLVAIELPGHGSRFHSNSFDGIDRSGSQTQH